MTTTPDDETHPPGLMMFGTFVRRRTAMLVLTVAVGLAGAAYLGYRQLHGRLYETTEDAYVGGNLVQLMPQTAGGVVTIYADDTDLVEAGQTLVKLDTTDNDIALEQAKAELAQAVREVRVLFASRDQLVAEVAVRESELARARADVARREGLTERGLVPREELDHARDTLATAEASLQAARENLTAMRARIDGTTVQNHPNVAHAAARLKDARVAVERALVRAPVSGYIAKRAVQVGQRVEPGMPLMAIVPVNDLWVDANFKEVQLQRMRIGQKAHVTADLYGQRVEYDGVVAGVGMGTGAAFALLPAQNASGNWIKVVQRVPVRIRLDAAQLAQHPLRIGLSMRVKVDLRDDGPQLAQATRSAPAYETKVFGDAAADADRMIKQIVAANIGAPTRPRPNATTNEPESSVAHIPAP